MIADLQYPNYLELYMVFAALARRVLIKVWRETGNISQVARLYQTTGETGRKELKRAELEKLTDLLSTLFSQPGYHVSVNGCRRATLTFNG